MGCQFTAHTASKKPSALEMAARNRRGGRCGDWSTGMVCPWEAHIKEQAAALRAISNVQVHLKPSNAMQESNMGVKQHRITVMCNVQKNSYGVWASSHLMKERCRRPQHGPIYLIQQNSPSSTITAVNQHPFTV